MRQKNNKKIFIDTGNNKELAYIGKENIFSQFYYYTVGYYNTAKILIEHTLNLPNTSSEYAKEEELRLCVAPACFLYRQYLELTLKDIYIQYSEDSEDAKKRMIKNTSHDLKKIWEYAKPLIGKAVKGMDSDINTYAMIESYILEFASEDSTSFKYRYPITKDLNFIFPQERKINIRNLMECMDEVEEFLAGRGLLAWLDMYKLRREYEKHINYALEYSKQDKYQEALNQYQEALIWIKKWSEDHTDIVFITYEMAQIYFKIENFDNSLLLYHQCADLYEKIKKIKDIPFNMIFNTWLGLIHYYLLNGELFAPQDSVLARYKNTLIECFMVLIKQ